MSLFVDTSVLLRVILRAENALPDPSVIHAAYCSALARVEGLRTLDRMRLLGRFDDKTLASRRASFLDLLEQCQVVEPDAVVLARASAPFPTVIATLDALHVATALEVRASIDDVLAFASHDIQQRVAAQALGFPVIG